MTREIKFRAWDKVNNEMTLNDSFYEVQKWNRTEEELKDFELMQYTGLKDKNGIEIYEGDIIKYEPYCNLGYKNIIQIGEVEWGETGDSDGWLHNKHYEWVVGNGNSEKDTLADISDGGYCGFHCEIIGNIYQNKDLLK